MIIFNNVTIFLKSLSQELISRMDIFPPKTFPKGIEFFVTIAYFLIPVYL